MTQNQSRFVQDVQYIVSGEIFMGPIRRYSSMAERRATRAAVTESPHKGNVVRPNPKHCHPILTMASACSSPRCRGQTAGRLSLLALTGRSSCVGVLYWVAASAPHWRWLQIGKQKQVPSWVVDSGIGDQQIGNDWTAADKLVSLSRTVV